MVWALKKMGLVIASILCVFQLIVPASAAPKPEDVQLTVPDTTIRFTGYAAPGALVEFKDAGSVVGTVSAGADGYYDKTVTSVVGIRNITVQYTDANGLLSRDFNESFSVQAQQETTVDSLLPPTIIKTSAQAIQRGALLEFQGYAPADTSVNIVFSNGISRVATAGPDGFYVFNIDSTSFATGNYSAEATYLKNAAQSSASETVSFDILPLGSNAQDPEFTVLPVQIAPPVVSSPENGSVLEDRIVAVSGSAEPGSQVVIYENDVIIGSVFTNNDGFWTFSYEPSGSPVTLRFEACIDGRCSVLSKPVTLFVPLVLSASANECSQELRVFELEKYRFWGEELNDGEVQINVLLTNGDGVLYIDWGDGSVEERFNHDASRPEAYEHSYVSGKYNGVARFVQGDCELIRYFSADVENGRANFNLNSILLFLLLAVLLVIGYLLYRNLDREQTKSI